MAIVLITGSGGLIGSEAARYYASRSNVIVGIDNDMRARFFGEEASTAWAIDQLNETFDDYLHHDVDIRDRTAVEQIVAKYSSDISLVIHTAAQPSHDWAAREPHTDFEVNAVGTLNMLEAVRQHSPDAVFVFTSTNKVYGDRPNSLPLVELDSRWELREHRFAEHGIDETMGIDRSTHSLFGASKVAADVLVQEYGRYFGMRSAVFRGGCLTGPGHSGTQLHGFLAYLLKCTMTGKPYTVFGYKGKQVRDNIHSADLIAAFDAFYNAPRVGEVYNIGGGRHANCSMLEAISSCEEIVGRRLNHSYEDSNRVGDHIWYISDVRRFQAHYPNWHLRYGIRDILVDIVDQAAGRWIG